MVIIYTARAKKDNIQYIYIGLTTGSLEERKKQHESAAAKNAPESFHKTMRKIPFDDWVWEPLFSCDDSEAVKKEKEVIARYREEAIFLPNIIVLNDTYSTKTIKQDTENRPDHGIPRAHKQKNYAPSEMGQRFARISGKLKPVINLKTQKIYGSIEKAADGEKTSKSTIKTACRTGRKTSDGTNYAYLDLNDNPILNEGHNQDRYIGQNAKKVKELRSGIIYKNSIEVANKYGLSSSSVSAFASGKDLIAKDQFIFCYLDANNVEIRTPNHEKALIKNNKKEQINYIAWPVDFLYEEAKQCNEVAYFKTLHELYKGLNIKNRSHVKAVCDGHRSHVEMRRIAHYDNETEKPLLTPRHLTKSKKIIRNVQCLNDGIIFNNCTEAGYKYSVDANQIGLCAKGILKSVRVKNKETNQSERLRFAYLDKSNKPILKPKHKEPLLQRKGISKIALINQNLGTSTFSSLAEFCRVTGVPKKRARKYLTNKTVDLDGYEFIVVN